MAWRRGVGVLLIIGIIAFGGCKVAELTAVPARITLVEPRVALPVVPNTETTCLFVDAKINGQGPFRLLVDTGAFGLALMPRVAAAANLKPIPGQPATVVGASGKTRKASLTYVERVESGGFRAERFRALLLDEADAENFRGFGGLDGFLGLSVFRDVILELDFPRRQVYAVRRGVEQYPAAAAVGHDNAVVDVEIGGKPLRMTIDTGFEGTFDLPLDDATLRYPRTKRGGQSVSLGELQQEETSQFDGELHLGPITWVNPPVSNGLGLIGSRALRTWKLVVDQQDKKFYFVGSSTRRQWPTAVLRARVAGYEADYEGTTLRIRRVESGSAAAVAGLQPDDVVLTINGAPAAAFVTGNSPSANQPRMSRRYRVRRAGQELELMVDVTPSPAQK